MSLGDLIWNDNGAGGGISDNGQLDGGESGIPGVVVELRDSGGNPILVNTSPVRTTTDTDGRYLFTGLTPGDYVVHILNSNFDGVGDPLYGQFSSTGGPDPNNDADEDTDENGVDDAAPQTNGISSLPITLTAGGEPQGNGYSNRTLDFGFVSYDMGDLPDTGVGTGSGNYQTRLNDNGARHVIDGQTYLGAGVDTEIDGLPNIPATGDDTNPSGQPDDEDGIVFLEPIMPGQPFDVQITASTDGFLNAWFDFDGDGVLGAGEQVAGDRAITSGTATYTLTAPASATPFTETLYSRFRFTRNSGEVSAPIGTASNGEVEDYVLLSLGNLVWHDNGAGAGAIANDGVKQAGESGVPDVTVELYLESQTPGVDTPIATTTTDANGNYLFSGLTPDDYRVYIPSGEFGAAGDLYQYFSTADQSGFDNPNNNRDDDQDENGIGDETDTPAADGVASGIISLDYNDEPQGNGYANLTVDFGFLQYDFGDVPDTYGTTLSANGARHGIVPDLYLGANIDAETDGQPDNEADADDNNPAAGPNDEDGVVFTTPILPNEVFRIEVTASLAGYLNGWIDYNGNGVFEPGERMWSDQPLTAGVNTLSLTSGNFDPTAASSIYARFRFTEGQNQATSPTGAANNGEVEDYALVSLGDLVWLDNGAGGGVGNDGIRQPGEQGLDGVRVELYLAADNPLTTPALASFTTANGGRYLFTGLTPNREYKVHIPPSQFVSTGPLYEYFSTNGNGVANDNINEDDPGDPAVGDENGIDPTNPIDAETVGITSGSVQLRLGDEPPFGGTYDGDIDPNSNLTVDFGFLQYDFGDAPDSYGTTLSATGARHLLDGETYLGARADSEWDGPPTDTALGDDAADTPDDEDGIVFLTPIMPGEPFDVRVTASTASFLNAWMDWNGNGAFDAGEQLWTNQAVGATPTTLTLTAPAAPDPFPTTLYSRFRLTRDSWATPSPTGEAPSPGEVEDYALGSIGSRLWRDNGVGTTNGIGNNNARQDGTEPGLPGATVELYLSTQTPGVDAPIATTTTDANGDYRFTGLDEGNYVVHIPPANFITGGALENLYSSSDPPGGTSDPNTDHDDHDVDENGIDDDYPYDNGLSSLPIELQLGTEPTGENNGTDTDANSDLTLDFGFIRMDFGDLPDQYPTAMANSAARHIVDDVTFLGSSVDAESDGKPDVNALEDDNTLTPDDEDGVTFLTPIMPGQPYTIEVVASVDGFLNAWIDFNGDGVLGAGEQISSDEPLTAGTNTLTLTAPVSSVPFASTLYSRFRLSANAGEVTAPDGLAPNGEVEDYALMSLGNLVWEDDGSGGGIPDDGRLNGSEAGIPDVNVELYLAGQTPGTDTPIATTVTDADGRYLFTGLNPGDYFVHIPASEFGSGEPLEELVSSLNNGDPNSGSDENTDENGVDNINRTTEGISSGTVTLAFGTEPTNEDGNPNSDLTIDLGFVQLASLGDYVWLDMNYDGVQDAGEDGIAGVVINLYDNNGTLVASTTTDSDGGYLFEDLRPGDYIVEIDFSTLPPGVVQTYDADGGLDNKSALTLAPGEHNPNQDFGYVYDGAIGDTVWLDLDGDGVQDAGEAGIAGVTINLYDGNGNLISTAVTDADGKYLFDHLPPGDYTVKVDISTLPPELAQTYDADGGLDSQSSLTLAPGEQNLDQDFGYNNEGAIGDTVWLDLDGDGVQDAGEAGIPGVTINLYDGNGNLIGTAVTDSDGKYLFDHLPPGNYTVKVDISTLPPELAQTYDADGGLDHQSSLTLASGEINLDQDFGYQPPAGSIGDTIWLDTNGNGVQDAGEPGIPGVTVYLYDGTGSLIATTVTDTNGHYLFTDLPAGDYTVKVDISTLPPELAQTYDADGGLDSQSSLTLGAGEANLDQDFGYMGDNLVQVEASDLAINKSVSPREISPGEAVIYTVTLINSSSTDITDAQVEDKLPDGFTYLSGSSVFNGSAVGDPSGTQDLTWRIDLQAGRTSTLQYKATADAGLSEGVYDNVVVLSVRNYTGEEITTIPVSAQVAVLTGRADCCLTIEKEHVRQPKPPAIIPVDQDIYFITDMSMFATYEFEQLSRKLDSLLRSDLMLTEAEERLKAEYLRITRKTGRYAHFNLGNLTMQSGLGLDMRHAPDIQAEAAQNKISPEEVVPVRLNLLAKRAGLKTAPQIQPLVLEYYGGAPYYAEDADKGNWRWADDDIDKALTPSAWGLTLLRQSMALPELMASNDPYQRFIGAVSLWQMTQKVKLIHDQLVVTGAAPDEIKYLPHRFKLEKREESGESATPVFTVQDASSHLFDQTAMLWGLTRMRNALTQAGVKSGTELDALIAIVWRTLETLHYNKDLQTYYPVYKPALQDDAKAADAKAKQAEKTDESQNEVQPAQASDQKPDEPDRDVLTAFDLMMTTLAFDSLSDETPAGTLRFVAEKRLAGQIRFLKNKMIDKDGGVYAGYNLTQEAPVTDVKDLMSQAAAIRMLLVGKEISMLRSLIEEKNYATVLKIDQFMEDKLWDDKYGIYRDNTHWRIQSVYTPLNVGAVIGALRELSLRLPEDKRLQVWNRMSLFLTQVVGKAELQLEEDRDLADDESAALYLEEDVYSAGRRPIPTTRRRASDDRTLVKSKGNLAPVIIRKVSLSLIPQDVVKLRKLVESSVTRADQEALENADFHTPTLFPALIKQKQFDTGPGMLASNELENASRYLLKNAVITDNAYLFDPSRVKHFATVLDEIAYANLLRLSYHFEQGVPLKFSAPTAAMAHTQGVNRERALADWMKQAAAESGLLNIPDIAEPIFIEYKNGEPAHRQSLERGWNARDVDHIVSASGLAQTMNSQIRFIKDHGSDKTNIQGAALRRYLARVMGLQIASRIKFMESAFEAARKQGLAYLPALSELVVDSDGMPLDIKFENPQSTLFSQVSLLQAFGNLIALDKDSASLIPGYEAVSQSARRLLDTVWKHVQKTYADSETQALNAQDLTALDAGLVLVMLGEMYHELPDDVAFKTTLKELLQRHAEFVMDEMIQSDGNVNLTYPVSEEETIVEDQLASFSAVLLGLIRVSDFTDQAAVMEKIMKLYDHLEENLWDTRLGVYLSRQEHSYVGRVKATRIEYTDLDLGITVSALAELLPLLADPSDRHQTAKRLTDFGNRLLVRQNLTDDYQTMHKKSDNNLNADSKPAENKPAYPSKRSWNVKSYDPEIVQGVEILLTDQDKSEGGYLYTYIITVKNICPDQITLGGPLYDLLVRDQLPEDMTYIPGSSTLNGQGGFEPAFSGQNLVWKIAQLDSGEQAVITFKTLFDKPDRNGEYINKVDVNGWGGGEADNRRGQCEYADEDDLKIEAGFGKIEGSVFMDRDENGVLDATETPVAEIRFKLDGVQFVTTDKGGEFVFDDLEPGFYRINADWSSVKPELLATTDFITSVQVKKGVATRLKFGFNQYKQVFTQVYDDRNNNGKPDPGEPGVHAVRVHIRDTDYHAWSAEDGHIRIDRVPVGVREDLVISDQQPYQIKAKDMNLQLGPWKSEQE